MGQLRTSLPCPAAQLYTALHPKKKIAAEQYSCERSQIRCQTSNRTVVKLPCALRSVHDSTWRIPAGGLRLPRTAHGTAHSQCLHSRRKGCRLFHHWRGKQAKSRLLSTQGARERGRYRQQQRLTLGPLSQLELSAAIALVEEGD